MAKEIIASVFSVLIIAATIYGCAIHIHIKKNFDNLVYFPQLLLWLGIIESMITDFMCLYFAFIEPTFWAVCLSCVMGSLGILLVISYANCRIEYDDEGFTHKNFFGIKQRYTYNQITGVKGIHSADAAITISSRSYRHPHINLFSLSGDGKEICPVVIYAGKKRIRIDKTALGKEDFLLYVQKKYRQLHNGNNIPVIPIKKRKEIDIFNGNIMHSNQFIAAFISMIVVSVILGIFLFFLATSSSDIPVEEAISIPFLPTLFVTALAALWIIIGRNAHRIDRRIVRCFFRDEDINV